MNKNFQKAETICGGLKKLANTVGIAPSFAWQIKSGMRSCPIKVCVAIERATNGAVTRKDLRDDWREIWPELENQ